MSTKRPTVDELGHELEGKDIRFVETNGRSQTYSILEYSKPGTGTTNATVRYRDEHGVEGTETVAPTTMVEFVDVVEPGAES